MFSDSSIFTSGGTGQAKLGVFDLIDHGDALAFFANDVTVDDQGTIHVRAVRSVLTERPGLPPVGLPAGRRRREPLQSRNHRVEEVIKAAVEEGDLMPFQQIIEVLASPYEDPPGQKRHGAPPRPDQIVHQTFCGV